MRDDDARDAVRGIGAGTLVVCCAVVALVVVLLVGTFAFDWFSSATADDRGRAAQRDSTVADPNYRIAHYDAFFDRCQAVVAAEGRITLAAQSVSTDPTQRPIDEQNLRALRGSRLDLITQYNADAAKEGTAGQFRSSHLPDRLDPNGVTRCDV